MDEIIKQINERTGLPADQARVAAQTVVDYLKAHLPTAIAAQVDTALAGSVGQGAASQAQQLLGGMFGKKE